MHSTTDLYTRLSFRYVLTSGESTFTELFCIIAFSLFFFFGPVCQELCQFLDQIGMSHKLNSDEQELTVFDVPDRPFRAFAGDLYVSLRLIALSSVCFISASYLANAKGIQAVMGGALGLGFIVSVDDVILKSINDTFLLSKSEVFKSHIVPTFKECRKLDQKPVEIFDRVPLLNQYLSSRNVFYGKFRTIMALFLTLTFWVISISISFQSAMGTRSPIDYFDADSFFGNVGLLNLGILGFASLVMLAAEKELTATDLVNIVQMFSSMVWVYVFFYKVFMFGVLFWAEDAHNYRRCNYLTDICETMPEVWWRFFVAQFSFMSEAEMKSFHKTDTIDDSMWNINARYL